MRRLLFFLLMISLLVVLTSCASTASSSTTQQFSLSRSTDSSSEVGMIFGNVVYSAGFYFPTTSDILDISLLKTDPTTGLVSEISHQRIRNLLKFPIQFTVRYDKADIGETDSCTLIVTLLADDEIKAQGIALLQRRDEGFAEAMVSVMAI